MRDAALAYLRAATMAIEMGEYEVREVGVEHHFVQIPDGDIGGMMKQVPTGAHTLTLVYYREEDDAS